MSQGVVDMNMDVRELLKSLKEILRRVCENRELLLDLSVFLKVYVEVPSSKEMEEYIGRTTLNENQRGIRGTVFDIRIIENVEELEKLDEILEKFKKKVLETPKIFHWRFDQRLSVNIRFRDGERAHCIAYINCEPLILAANVGSFETLEKLRALFGSEDLEFLLI